MAYDFYFDRIRLPVTPSKLQVSINGKNDTLTLINEGEINILKTPGLTGITFTVMFPNARYPFAAYDGGFRNASYYLDELEKLKTRTDSNGKYLPFQFIVSRILPNGQVLYHNNIKVTLEDYKIIDDSANGFDIIVDITLKQYKAYGTKVVKISIPTPQPVSTPGFIRMQTTTTAVVEPNRPAENPPTQPKVTTIPGDTLPAIAQKQLGARERFSEVYALNKKEIDAKNQGTGNTKYTISAGTELRIPKEPDALSFAGFQKRQQQKETTQSKGGGSASNPSQSMRQTMY